MANWSSFKFLIGGYLSEDLFVNFLRSILEITDNNV